MTYDYETALSLLNRAERQAGAVGGADHVNALRALGSYYASGAPDGNLATADRMFGKAVDATQSRLSGGASDAGMLRETAASFYWWAFTTAQRRGHVDIDKLRYSQKLLKDANNANPFDLATQAMLGQVEQAISYATMPPSPPVGTPPPPGAPRMPERTGAATTGPTPTSQPPPGA